MSNAALAVEKLVISFILSEEEERTSRKYLIKSKYKLYNRENEWWRWRHVFNLSYTSEKT